MAADISGYQMDLKQELSSLSFEELLKLKDELGDKVLKSALSGNTESKNVDFSQNQDKNGPREVSSKQRVPFLRKVIPVKQKISRDPRFDDRCGTYHEHLYKASYSFLNNMKMKEKSKLKKSLKAERDPEKKEKIISLLRRIDARDAHEKKRENELEKKREWRKKEIESIKKGKKPFFTKESDKKLLELGEKYELLKKSGKITKYLIKRRKKNLVKDRKQLETCNE